MKITYLKHSSIVMELEHHILIFDDISKGSYLPNKNKKLYVFVSHAHDDHYDPHLYDYYGDQAIYLCSSDVNFLYAHHHFYLEDRYQDDDIFVQSICSSDQGVGFYIECEGWNIFFAGDHHLWQWEEDTKQEKKMMYQAYIKGLIAFPDQLDVACLVCDPRLPNRDDGLKEWLTLKQTKNIVPIHMWDDLSCQQSFLSYQNEDTKILIWNYFNETKTINKERIS